MPAAAVVQLVQSKSDGRHHWLGVGIRPQSLAWLNQVPSSVHHYAKFFIISFFALRYSDSMESL